MTCGSILLMCFEGGSATSVTGPLEIFRHAVSHRRKTEQRADAPAVLIVTPDDAPVACCDCVTVRPTTAIEATRQPDLVFLTGMSGNVDEALGRNGAVRDWLLAVHRGGTAIAAVCPSQALLAAAGLLDGRSAAVHWSFLDAFRARWPAVNWSADRLVVEDEGFYTACGASSALDLALYLVDRLFGREVMMECARWLLTDLPRVRQNVPPPLFTASRSLDPAMKEVEVWLHTHFREPIHFEVLAPQFGMSWRTFHRHFCKAFGDTPNAYLQKLRLAAARQVLESEAVQVDLVAHKVGYDDAAFFRALFKRYTGMTPSEYRENFRFRTVAGTGAGA